MSRSSLGQCPFAQRSPVQVLDNVHLPKGVPSKSWTVSICPKESRPSLGQCPFAQRSPVQVLDNAHLPKGVLSKSWTMPICPKKSRPRPRIVFFECYQPFIIFVTRTKQNETTNHYDQAISDKRLASGQCFQGVRPAGGACSFPGVAVGGNRP